ncbi:MAG: hypothetical protein JNJ83_02525 [Verrucomicrobiaceae bacterium]|nr:hypothetical protein [Verrucomicrobiaceae bacterium]
MSNVTKQPTAPFNPFYGCAVILTIIMFVIGVITWAWYTLNTQDKAISKFAVDAPVKLAVQKVDASAAEGLKGRLKDFADGKAKRLELSVTELNTLVEMAPDTGYGKFTEMIAFKGADEAKQLLVADVCLPMNKVKFWEGQRYAVGVAEFRAEIIKDAGPDMKLANLRVPGKEVEPMFVEALGGWHWLTPYQKLPQFTDVFKVVNKVVITANGVAVERP